MSLLWQEEEDEAPVRAPDDLFDLSFAIRGRSIGGDYAWALAEALRDALPWLAAAPQVGIHLHLGAEEGNGWFQAGSDTPIYLSRRTRLILRLSLDQVAAAERLSGHTLAVDGHQIEVGAAERHPLSTLTTLYARHVLSQHVDDEPAFLEESAGLLQALAIHARKAVCGRARSIGTPQGALRTRSLMLAELTPQESIALQRHGLGSQRQLGCGLFVPHKSIRKVQPAG